MTWVTCTRCDGHFDGFDKWLNHVCDGQSDEQPGGGPGGVEPA